MEPASYDFNNPPRGLYHLTGTGKPMNSPFGISNSYWWVFTTRGQGDILQFAVPSMGRYFLRWGRLNSAGWVEIQLVS